MNKFTTGIIIEQEAVDVHMIPAEAGVGESIQAMLKLDNTWNGSGLETGTL